MKQTTQSTGLTSFHGSTVKATVNEMKEVLGNVMYYGIKDDKVQHEWEMEDENGIRYNGIAFGLGDTIENFQDLKQFSFDICYHIQANEFNGKISLDMIIKDVKINKNK